MTQQQITDFFKPHAVRFWNATLERLTDDFGIYKGCEDYDNETFAETMEREFWSMGCDYIDYAKSLVDDYFYTVIDEQEYNELQAQFNYFDTEYRDLENYLFETYAMPKIKDIVNNGGIL
jgi:hypothetical protein